MVSSTSSLARGTGGQNQISGKASKLVVAKTPIAQVADEPTSDIVHR